MKTVSLGSMLVDRDPQVQFARLTDFCRPAMPLVSWELVPSNLQNHIVFKFARGSAKLTDEQRGALQERFPSLESYYDPRFGEQNFKMRIGDGCARPPGRGVLSADTTLAAVRICVLVAALWLLYDHAVSMYA